MLQPTQDWGKLIGESMRPARMLPLFLGRPEGTAFVLWGVGEVHHDDAVGARWKFRTVSSQQVVIVSDSL